MRIKKISLKNRQEYIEALQKEIKEQERIIQIIETYSPSNMEERIIHEYAIEGAISDVAHKLNEEGFRIEGRKYLSDDVSAVIKQKPKTELHEIVRKAFDHNKKGIRHFN